MIAAHALEYAALAVAVAGLLGVVLEILVKDPAVFGEWVGGKAASVRDALAARRAAKAPVYSGRLGHA